MDFSNKKEAEEKVSFRSAPAPSSRSDLVLASETSEELAVIPISQEISKNNFIFDLTNDPNMLSIGQVLTYETLSTASRIRLLSLPGNVKEVKKVCNPFIDSSFELTKHFKYPNTAPRKLYHGTKMRHVDSICTNNFDWRLSGTERGHKHGWGVNFTQDLGFAENFCDKNSTKVAIISEVLIRNTTEGHINMRVPPEGFDTVSARGKVYVKFSDAEFRPCYVAYFN